MPHTEPKMEDLGSTAAEGGLCEYRRRDLLSRT
jgi:hypothetical protein